MKKLDVLATHDSLGAHYQEAIAYVAYTRFDEYKLMGLAPYGEPARFGEVFRDFFALLPEGEYRVADL